MNRWFAMLIVIVAAHSEGNGERSLAEAQGLCSAPWQRFIEEQVSTDDGQGHGPDLGTDEWKSVVEFRLGIRDKPGVPSRNSEAWCRHIDRLVHRGHASSEHEAPGRATHGTSPSFACDQVEGSSIEAMVCEDEQLAALDRKLADVYVAASRQATNEQLPMLKAEQRGWIKGRDECWKRADKRACVRDEYLRRIAALQARYRLVPHAGPVRFRCDANPANDVVATFFHTNPPTLIAERGDSVSLMYAQPSASGSRYQGRNETFWEHQGEALITWGHGAAALRCERAP